MTVYRWLEVLWFPLGPSLSFDRPDDKAFGGDHLVLKPLKREDAGDSGGARRWVPRARLGSPWRKPFFPQDLLLIVNLINQDACASWFYLPSRETHQIRRSHIIVFFVSWKSSWLSWAPLGASLAGLGAKIGVLKQGGGRDLFLKVFWGGS